MLSVRHEGSFSAFGQWQASLRHTHPRRCPMFVLADLSCMCSLGQQACSCRVAQTSCRPRILHRCVGTPRGVSSWIFLYRAEMWCIRILRNAKPIANGFALVIWHCKCQVYRGESSVVGKCRLAFCGVANMALQPCVQKHEVACRHVAACSPSAFLFWPRLVRWPLFLWQVVGGQPVSSSSIAAYDRRRAIALRCRG